MRNVSLYNPANFGNYSRGLGNYSRMGQHTSGIGFFGKGAPIAPPPSAPQTDPAMLMMLQMMMEELRELRKYRPSASKDAQISNLEDKVDQIAAAAPADQQAATVVKEIKQEIVKQVTPVREQQRIMENRGIITSDASEAEVTGAGGKNVRELLTSAGATKFMRSTNKPGANLEPGHFRTLLKDVPADFDEEKYLAKHPDIAKAVKIKAMPSGLWHYVKYGKKEGRALAGFDLGGLMQNKLLLAGVVAAAGYYFLVHNKR